MVDARASSSSISIRPKGLQGPCCLPHGITPCERYFHFVTSPAIGSVIRIGMASLFSRSKWHVRQLVANEWAGTDEGGVGAAIMAPAFPGGNARNRFRTQRKVTRVCSACPSATPTLPTA